MQARAGHPLSTHFALNCNVGTHLRMQAGAGHPFSTHIVLNCNVGTRLALQESESIKAVKYIKHPQGYYADRSKGVWQGMRMQMGAKHPFSTHIALNYIVGTLLGLQESKCIETVKYIKHPQGHYADRSKAAWQGAENAGGIRAPFKHPYCF